MPLPFGMCRFITPTGPMPLAVLLDAIPASHKDIAAHLGISVRTLHSWIATDSAPRAAVVALYLESDYGRQSIHTELHNRAALMSDLADCLRRERSMLRARIERLESLAEHGSANEAYITRVL